MILQTVLMGSFLPELKDNSLAHLSSPDTCPSSSNFLENDMMPERVGLGLEDTLAVLVVKVTVERTEASITKEDRYFVFTDALVANETYDRYADLIQRDRGRQSRYVEVRFVSCQLYDAKSDEPKQAENLVRSNQATCFRDSNRPVGDPPKAE